MELSNILYQEVSRQIDLVAVLEGGSDERPWQKSISSENVEYKHQLEEIRGTLRRQYQTSTEWKATEVNPDLALKIVTYCGSTPWFVDPNDLKWGLRTLIQNRREQPVKNHSSYTKLWTHPLMLQWAASHRSCSLHLQSSLVSASLADIVAIDLIEYLIAKGEKVVWMFNTLICHIDDEKVDLFLKQLVVQMLMKNKSFRSLGQIAEIVRLMNAATSGDSSWLEVIYGALEGIPAIYMVIDASIYLPTPKNPLSQASNIYHLENLIDGLIQKSSPTILKILFYGVYPMMNVAGSIPTICIERPMLENALPYRGYQDESRPDNRSKAFAIDLPLYHKNEHINKKGPTVETAARRAPREVEPSSSKENSTSSDEGMARGGMFAVSKIEENSKSRLGVYQGTNELKSCGFPETGGVAAKPKAKNDWFHEMKFFETFVDASRREPDESSPRVKIAILDTGLDLTHPDIAKEHAEGRIKTYDFVDNCEDIKDNDGHGTHCTSLLLSNAPNAEIYVGRVFKKSKAETNSTVILTKAIEYAVSVWKVDIISLSLGFTQDDDDLRDEVLKASANKLIFAAAANNTTNEVTPIRFPARMSEVICIFSSNSHGYPSPFNPPARYDRPNFTFPGEGIEGAWPENIKAEGTFKRGDSTYKYQDGTSCATPIAAAVAAGVLEYARQDRERPIRRARLLKHYRGMTTVFLNEMVDRHKVGDKDFHYVKPWMLMSEHQPQDEVPSWISRILDKIS